MNVQIQEIIDVIRKSVETHLDGADPLVAKKACLIGASELVAHAAQTVSGEAPGIPVVELLLLSERIASLAEAHTYGGN